MGTSSDSEWHLFGSSCNPFCFVSTALYNQTSWDPIWKEVEPIIQRKEGKLYFQTFGQESKKRYSAVIMAKNSS